MPYRHKLQASRFEFKFVISQACARAVREFILAGPKLPLEHDEHANPNEDNAYSVHSLYIDSPDLVLFRQTDRGLRNRFKLRIRFYDDNSHSPAYLEIKRRVSDVIRKERAAITRAAVEYLLDGGWPDASYLMASEDDEKSGRALQNFCNLSHSIGGCPHIYVSYMREAYVLPDSDRLRLTFDRQLMGSLFHRDRCLVPPTEGTRPQIGNDERVILEVKFTDRFPGWMNEMVQAFSLQRRSVPKYNMCIEALDIRPGMRPI